MEGVTSIGKLIGTGIELLKGDSCGGGSICDNNTLEERGAVLAAVKEDCDATILIVPSLVGWTVVEEKQLDLVSAAGKQYKL